MKKFFSKVIPSLFVAVVGLTITHFITTYRDKNNNAKRYIDCFEKVNYTDLDSLELKEHDMEILYKGNSVYGLVSVDVELYNFSDKDCENIRVLIEITPQKSDSLQLVEDNVCGPHSLPSGFKRTKDNAEKALKGSIKLEYLIETANRADSSKDVMFDANYSIIAMNKPTINVTIWGKGIEKRKYERTHFKELEWWETETAEIWMIIICGIITLITALKILFYFDNKRNERWKKYLLKHLTERVNSGKVNYDAPSIIEEYRDISNRFDYDDASKIMRWLKKLKQPEENY